jgi:G3E family GTPase
MVSVVDAYAMYDGFDSGTSLVDDETAGGTDRIPEEILMDQIEFCDVLLLNKCDLVPDEELDEIEAVLEALQPRARIVRTEFGRVSPSEILETGRFDFEDARTSAGWRRELHRRSRQPEWDEEYGDRKTELVLIGRGTNRERLERTFDDCRATETELEDDPTDLENPFPTREGEELRL